MAFVNEKDPNNSDTWRTIDYERNIVLRDVGRDRDKRSLFNITFNSSTYAFWAYEDSILLPEKKYDLTWHVQEIDADPNTAENLKPIIVEALTVYGLYYSHELVAQTKIDFIKLPNRSPV